MTLTWKGQKPGPDSESDWRIRSFFTRLRNESWNKPRRASSGGESLFNSQHRTVNLGRLERAHNEGTTGPKRLDDTRCITYKRRNMYRTEAVTSQQISYALLRCMYRQDLAIAGQLHATTGRRHSRGTARGWRRCCGRTPGTGCSPPGSESYQGFRVQRSGFRVQGSGFRLDV